MEQSGSNFWPLMAGIARRRRLVMWLPLLATLVAVIVTLVLPQWYEAQTLLVPTESDALPFGQMAPRNLPSISGLITLPGVVTPADIYSRMLRSRTISQSVITRFDLQSRYGTGSFTDTYLALMKHSRFEVTDEGLLSISVEDRIPDTAAALANAFAVELRGVIKKLLSTRGRQKREFIEDRLIQIKSLLDSARLALEEFQTINRTIDLSAQTRLAMEQAIQLKIQMSRVDIDLEMEQRVRGSDNPKVVRLQQKREAIGQQIMMLETGNGDSSFFAVPLAAMPGLRGKYEDLYSQVRVSESLYEILLEQLEQAKIQESEQAATFSILDPAETPEFRSRPQRTLIVGATFGLALVCSVLLALLLNYVEALALRSDDENRMALYAITGLLGWLPGIKRAARSGSSGTARSKNESDRKSGV